MLKSFLKVSKHEEQLIGTCREVKYGEVFGAAVPDAKYCVDMELSENELALIDLLRTGIVYVDVLTLHAGEPAMVEIDCRINGFSCRRKIKLTPTS